MAGSSTVRQSKTILARSVKRAGTLQILAIVLQGPNVHEGRHKHSQGCARRKRSFTRIPSASAGASRLLPSKTNAAKVLVVYKRTCERQCCSRGARCFWAQP